MVINDSTEPRFFELSRLRNYLMPPIASRELRNIVVSLGAAMDHIPVTNAVVIKTTKTQPGTSALLFPLTFLIIKLVISNRKLLYFLIIIYLLSKFYQLYKGFAQ